MTGTNPRFVTQVRAFDAAAIEAAALLIDQGLPVAVPTETVYGLAADATDAEAVARIYEAKGRPAFNPLIVHVRDLAAAEQLGAFDVVARRLALAFWPGPLTVVLPRRDDCPVASLATAGLPTIALRVPAHEAMQALLAATGKPLAAPSANASGRLSPTRAAHVLASLEGRIPLVIDAGPTRRGLESTIVAVDVEGTNPGAPSRSPQGEWRVALPPAVQGRAGGTTDPPLLPRERGRLRLLRPGPIAVEDIAEAAGVAVDTAKADAIEAPGQLASHYAPAKPLRLDATAREGAEWLIGFGDIAGDATLSAGGDLIEAAANLFDRLHEADEAEAARIAVAPIPETGLGAAINDRLARAAA